LCRVHVSSSPICCYLNREQNTLEEGAEQLALAFDQYGVNFIDTYV
jgi:hypothetical protein